MKSNFKDRLKELRLERNINQNTLAKMLDRPQQHISRWEKGITEPNINDLIKLAIYFNVSVDYLLGLSNSDINSWIKEEKEVI